MIDEIDEILELRKASGIDFGETYPQLIRYYRGVRRIGCLEYIIEDGELKGFVDWIRLPEIPKKRNFTWGDYVIAKGDYVYITTICAKEKKYFWELIRRVRKKESRKGKHLCWHTKNGQLKVYKNVKRPS